VVSVWRVQVSETDVFGSILCSFTDVKSPRYLSTDSEGHVIVADWDNDRVLLLTKQLQLQRVLLSGVTEGETNSLPGMLRPKRLYHNEKSSQLYVLHSNDCGTDVVSLFTIQLTAPPLQLPEWGVGMATIEGRHSSFL